MSERSGERSAEQTLAAVKAVADTWQDTRAERQTRTQLDPSDFDALAKAGFTLTGVPENRGGLWSDPPTSGKLISRLVRVIAKADSSVALVSAMHPTILAFWALACDGEPENRAWQQQCDAVFGEALEGRWWGTIASEPGSGGDLMESRAMALPDPAGGPLAYRLTGDKHMGSGSGITSCMLTVARVPDEETPDVFFVRTAGVPWDGTAGVRLVREWDGHGMSATQSHAFRFDDMPVERYARPGSALGLVPRALSIVACTFTSVIVGVLDAAMAEAWVRLDARRSKLRALERVEWIRARNEAWLARQTLDAMLGALDGPDAGRVAALHGKFAVAELAESALSRLGKAIGGATFSQSQPFGQWTDDVRALGFLRPPWGLAADQLFDLPSDDPGHPSLAV